MMAHRSCLRMTIAEAGHADWNSTDSRTDGGTCSRPIGSKPNLGKNRSAVVVNRKTVVMPRLEARLQRRIRELMAKLPALEVWFDGDGPQQRAVSVQLQRRGADDLLAVSRNEHRRQVLVHARQRQMQSLEQSPDLRQVALRRGFNHGCDSCARGAQHAPPAGASNTYSCPNER